MARLVTGVGTFLWFAAIGGVSAGEVRVAVATNFAATLAELAPGFERSTGHRLIASAGATGQLYAQILRGAPHDVLLAADRERPRLLVESGHAVADSLFVYARGRLALCSTRHDAASVSPELFLAVSGRRVVIANPKLAPYGRAARAWLDRLSGPKPAVVLGGNVGQAFAVMASGNVDAGIVALAQALTAERAAGVPASLSCRGIDADPIPQAAVQLTSAADSTAASALLAYLRSDAARTLMATSGYPP